ILGRNQRDASFAAAKAERALGGAAERHRPRRIEIGQFDVGAVASLHRTDTDRDVGAEMRVRNLLNGVASGDHRLKRRRIEQHVPDALGWRANIGLAFAAQSPVAALLDYPD